MIPVVSVPSDQNALVPSLADAVVIGAGAFGLATGFQLANLGLKHVVVIDQYEPATQTSPKAAGLFKCLQTTEVKTRLTRLSIDIVRNFERDTGVAMPHQAVGSLLIGRTPEHASMVEAEVEDGRGWGVQVQRVDRNEANLLCSYVNGSRFLSVYYLPGDIYIEEPRSMLVAYVQAGRRLGMKVIGHTPVTGIQVKNGSVHAVQTPAGTIRTPVVVDAAGAWSRIVGAMAGADIPIQPMRHQLRITAPIDGIEADQPIIRILDVAAYARPARGGLMVGAFESNPLPFGPKPGERFTLDMVPMSDTLVDEVVDTVKDSITALDGVTSQEDRGGLFTMTADGRFLAGPVSSVRGLWVATGCNGTGCSMSSGVGRCLAEWIVGGESPIDRSLLNPDRFSDTLLSDQQLRDAAVWQYANYYTPR
jgi:glycine/D-amino acid oxidase-like deaminating enzyme